MGLFRSRWRAWVAPRGFATETKHIVVGSGHCKLRFVPARTRHIGHLALLMEEDVCYYRHLLTEASPEIGQRVHLAGVFDRTQMHVFCRGQKTASPGGQESIE